MHDLSEHVQTIMINSNNKKKYGAYNSKDAAIYLRDNDKTSTAKDLYLAGKLVENADSAGIGEKAFNEKLKMIYITTNKDDFDFPYDDFFYEHIALNKIPKVKKNNDNTWMSVKQLIRNIYKAPKDE